MQIIPAILTNNLSELTNLEYQAESVVNRIQIDVIDNKFAANSTVDPAVLKNISTSLNLDYHLMVKDPVEWVSHCVRPSSLGADRIIAQVEYMPLQNEFVEKVTAANCLPGLALDIDTPITKLNKSLLSKVDVILIMSVKAGFDHQEFDLSSFDKVKELVKLKTEKELNFNICIDGGITKELANQLSNLGVDEIAVGKRIFEPNLKDNLRLFLKNEGQN